MSLRHFWTRDACFRAVKGRWYLLSWHVEAFFSEPLVQSFRDLGVLPLVRDEGEARSVIKWV